MAYLRGNTSTLEASDIGGAPGLKPHIVPDVLYPAVNGLLTKNTSGTFTDSGNTGHPGLLSYGSTHHSSLQAKIGSTSLKFDGSGDYLTVPSIPNFDNYSAYCIEMWVNTTDEEIWVRTG